MVNRGFSRACEHCRSQHTRCDETRPACLRCTKRGINCPGYRSNGVILFQPPAIKAPRRTRKHCGKNFIKGNQPEMTTLLNIQMNSSAIDRSAYCVIFADSYFDQEPSNRELQAVLGEWATTESSLLITSTAALVLLYVASDSGSEHLAARARWTHLKALSSLRQEVSRPDMDLMAVLGSAELLLCCEAYSLVSSFDNDPAVMQKHLLGMAAAVTSRSDGHLAASLSPFLIRQMRHAVLVSSLLSRRQVVEESVWNACRIAPLPPALEHLVELAWELAQVLHEVDKGVVAQCRQRQHILLPLLELEDELLCWQRENGVEQLPGYGERGTDTLASMGPLRSPLLRATQYAFVWSLLAMIRMARHMLIREDEGHKCVLQDLDDCTTALSSCVKYFRSTAGSPVNKALTIRAPLHFAIGCCKASADFDKLAELCKEETLLRKETSFLKWDLILPKSFIAMYWLVP